MSDDIKKLKVVIEADASRYKKAINDVKRDTKEGVSSIQNAVKKNLDLDPLNTNGIKSKLADVKRQISDTFGNIRSIAGLDNLQNPFTNLIQNMRASKKEAMIDSGRLSFTPDYQNAIDGIERMNKALERYHQQESDFSAAGVPYESQEWAKVQGKIYDAENALKSYKAQKKELEESGGDVMKTASIGSSLSGKAGGISSVFGNIKNAFSSIGSGAKSAFTGASATIKKFGSLFSGLLKGARNVGSYVSGGLLSGFRLFGRDGGGAISRIGSGFGKILKYTIGIRSLFVLTNRLRSAVTEGLQNLALYDQMGSVNQNLSLLMSSLTQLKNAWGAAFKPILEVVTPYLNALIQGLVSATNKLAQFFAALTGHKVATQAVKINQNYAASLNNSAASAKKATEETKKYQNQLYGFDEINKADKTDSGTTTDNSGSSYNGVNPADMFEEKGIDGNVRSLADKIKQAWQRADFSGIGGIVASKINGALAAIPWGKIQTECNRAAAVLATFINGLVKGADWGLVGRSVANGINTISGAVHKFFTMTDWYALGDGIGESIQASFDNIDWVTLGKSLTDGIRALANTAHGILRKLDFSKIGTDIGVMINAGLENIPWEQMIGDAVKGITGIFTALSKTIDAINWRGLTQRISNGITGADWKGLGTSLSDALASALQGAIDILETFDWEGFGKSIIDFIVGINWLDLLAKSYEVFAGIVTAVPRMIGGAIKKTDWSSVGNSIVTSLQNFDWSGVMSRIGNMIGLMYRGLIDLIIALVYKLPKAIFEAVGSYFDEQIDKAGENVVLGIYNGIKNAIVNIGEWIYKNIFKPFIDGFKSAFGIHSPASTMVEPGKQIIAGVLSGITDGFKNVVTFFTGMPGKIKDAMGNVKGWLKEKGSNIIDGIKTGIDNVKDSKLFKFFSGLGGTVKDKIGDIGGSIKSKGSEIVKGLSDGIDTSVVSDKISGIVDTIRNGLSGLWDIGSNAMDSLASGFRSIDIKLPHFRANFDDYTLFGHNVRLPRFSIDWYANGGMPDVGQMFIAREAGPELVGSIGNHSAVMNNGQIVDAVSEGVFKAVVSALDGQQRQTDGGEVVLMIDGEKIGRIIGDIRAEHEKRYSPVVSVY